MKTENRIIHRVVATGAVLGVCFAGAEAAPRRQHDTRRHRHSVRCPCGIASNRPDPLGGEGPAPRVPPIGHAVGIYGAVVVEVTIGEGGEVIAASAMSGPPLLRMAAEDAARERSFKPTELSGARIKAISTITFNFQSPDSSQAGPIGAQGQEQDPDYQALAKRQIGLHFLSIGAWTKAIDPLKEAIRLAPHDTQAELALGLAYSALRRDSEAAWMYKLAALNNPFSADAYLALGMSLSNLKKYKVAEAAFRRAIDLRPADVDPYVELGALYESSGRAVDGIATLREGTLANPELARPHFMLGMACLKGGDKNAARAEYDKLKAINSGMASDLMREIERRSRPFRRHHLKGTRQQ